MKNLNYFSLFLIFLVSPAFAGDADLGSVERVGEGSDLP